MNNEVKETQKEIIEKMSTNELKKNISFWITKRNNYIKLITFAQSVLDGRIKIKNDRTKSLIPVELCSID